MSPPVPLGLIDFLNVGLLALSLSLILVLSVVERSLARAEFLKWAVVGTMAMSLPDLAGWLISKV